MHFAILGITGHTGAAAADLLLSAGHSVRALVRNPSKAAAWAARGVTLVEGDLADPAALTATMKGVDGAYVLIPPQWGAPDLFAANAPIIDAIAQAVAAALSTLLERPVIPLELPPAALTETLRDMGAGHLAELYAEMSVAAAEGRLAYPDGEPVTRGATPVEATLAAMLGRG